jgi:predicted nucleic acid-binding protein
MPTRVVDVSALVAFAFDEAGAEDVANALRGHQFHAPALLTYELANAALAKVRRHPQLSESFTEALRLALSLPFTLHPLETQPLFALARETGLTAYDAAYLLLAIRLDAPIVTLDRALAAAANQLGLLAR